MPTSSQSSSNVACLPGTHWKCHHSALLVFCSHPEWATIRSNRPPLVSSAVTSRYQPGLAFCADLPQKLQYSSSSFLNSRPCAPSCLSVLHQMRQNLPSAVKSLATK